VWALAGEHAPDAGIDADSPIVIDTDATLLTAHSDKQGAAPTFKRGPGFHPLWAFVDHGADGTGEPLAVMLRPGNAGSNTAADHIVVVRDALKQLPSHRPGTRPGRRVLIRADSAGCTHDFLDSVAVSQRMAYSVGFTLPDDFEQALPRIPKRAWTPAYDADGKVRDGAWVADVTGLLNLATWPKGMRVIVRKERPHPGAQLRITDIGGHRITAFATNTTRGQLADLELRHRRRARAELSSTAKRPIHQIRQAADDSRDVNHWFSFLAPIPSSLAGTNRLVVPIRPYVVEAAPGLTPNPGISLPPASTGHCDDQRRTPPSARSISASWRTSDVVDYED
jgi:hypothetical protein